MKPTPQARNGAKPTKGKSASPKPQMSDIARLAGLSVGSVSRALSGSPEVGEKTRERVIELARSLGYTVNVGASNLRRGQSRTISVVTPLLEKDSQTLRDPFLWNLIGSIAMALTSKGFRMLLSCIPTSQLNAFEDVENGQAAGVIFTGQWLPHELLNEKAAAKVPFALWGAEVPRQLYCTVGTDNLLGGRLATEHLIARGARQLAYFGDTRTPEIAQRHQGFVDVIARHGIDFDPACFVPLTFDLPAVEQAVYHLLDSERAFDGIVASSDLSALQIMQALGRRGIRVPKDVAVVGYDDIPFSALASPSLSTIRQDLAAAGEALVDCVMQLMAGESPNPRVIATELVIRKSS